MQKQRCALAGVEEVTDHLFSLLGSTRCSVLSPEHEDWHGLRRPRTCVPARLSLLTIPFLGVALLEECVATRGTRRSSSASSEDTRLRSLKVSLFPSKGKRCLGHLISLTHATHPSLGHSTEQVSLTR